MRINDLESAAELEGHTYRTAGLFDSPRQIDPKNQSFLERFRHNQVGLKNKFKQYITNQKFRYPLVNRHIKTEVYSDDSEEQQECNFRAVRREKQRLTDQLQTSMNESKYLQKKKVDNLKTFYQLKSKFEKVLSIRQQRKQEVKKVEDTIKEIASEIRKEKLRYHQGIELSRKNLAQSRIACEQEKHKKAQITRLESEQHQRQLSQEKQQEITRNRMKCESVKEKERYTQLTVSQVKRVKKEQADQVKLDRLLRELAQKQEIKLANSRAKQQLTHRGKQEQPRTRVIQQKIRHFRKSLGERRLSPQPKIKLRLTHKLNPFSQSLQQYSTNSGFPFRSKKASYYKEQVESYQS